MKNIKDFFNGLVAWWKGDALSSKAVRIPLKLVIVGALAVIVLAALSYGAGKVSRYAGVDAPVTQAELQAAKAEILAALKPAAKVAPVKKSTKR